MMANIQKYKFSPFFYWFHNFFSVFLHRKSFSTLVSSCCSATTKVQHTKERIINISVIRLMIRKLKSPCFCHENQLCKQFCWVKDLKYNELLNCRSLLCLLKIENKKWIYSHIKQWNPCIFDTSDIIKG